LKNENKRTNNKIISMKKEDYYKQIAIENLKMANGRILIQETENRNIYKVVKVAKNVNYESLGKKIEIGDYVVCQQMYYDCHKIVVNGKEYYITKPSTILGYFQNK
jgi:co-chaperonin GroES (HSP10)